MRNARFTVTLSKASTSSVAVAYATVAGSAVPGTDFTDTSGTVTFEPGELTKDILIPVRDADTTSPRSTFTVQLSDPDGGELSTIGGSIVATIPGVDEEDAYSYANRFRRLYRNLHDPANGYYGPPSGPNARTMPYHCIETLICEAPDWGHESVSETVSFAVGLEAHKGLIDGDWTGYNKVWNTIDTLYVPNATNQPQGAYNPSSPADYTPEGDLPSVYPVLGQPTAPNGTDGLYDELMTTYGNNRMYLMHWMIDVDGAFGYKNGDGTTTGVYINNYSRGLQESAFETITHPEWEDFTQGGQTNQSKAGYLPLYAQSLPDYPAADFEYSKQWRYTCAPDAEARAVQWAFWGEKWAAAAGASATISASTAKAKKMGDYLRYGLMDKYFRQIGANRALGSTDDDPYTACHYLISWYVSWGGEIPATGTGTWSFRIGSSECHQGYQAPDIAYYMATGGGGFEPLSPSGSDIWLGSLYRQIEMLRWLQTEQGLIAGGVSNSWKGRYETPADGRENYTFYGMHYTYAPVWHDPPSNNWFGFQTWGMQRVADLFLEVSDKTTTLANTVRANTGIILDRWINWVLANTHVDPETREFSVPNNLKWTSDVEVPGETTNTPNLEGKYEYIPMNAWAGESEGQAAFWNASTVPNPTLKFTVDSSGVDLGVASSLISVLVHYAQAKRVQGKFTDVIPNNPNGQTAKDCFNLAVALADSLWFMYRDDKGLARAEQRADYNRYNDPVFIPTAFTGVNKTGDAMNQSSTFISLRSWQKEDPDWYKIQNYIDNPSETNIPVFTYHRFWATAEYAMSCAALSHYFGDLLPNEDDPSIDDE